MIGLAGSGVTIDNSTLVILLGTGGVAALGAFVKAILAFRDSAEARESKAIKNLERWRDEADDRALQCLSALDAERAVSTYWSKRCAAREYLAERNGVELPAYPDPPTPPPRPVLDIIPNEADRR